MTMELVDGPFSSLHGEWTLVPLGEHGCRIELRVNFEFASSTRDLLLGPAFELTCGGLVDAFVSRARKLYG
jgi:ribosome-associated toxin RatA of RatAB toxin-antitoxin module